MTGNSEISNTPSTSVTDATISPVEFLNQHLRVGEWTADNDTGAVTLKIGNLQNSGNGTTTPANRFQTLLLQENIGFTTLLNESAGYDSMSFSPESVGALINAIAKNKITMSGILNDSIKPQGPSLQSACSSSGRI
jgi:hypothetical protein